MTHFFAIIALIFSSISGLFNVPPQTLATGVVLSGIMEGTSTTDSNGRQTITISARPVVGGSVSDSSAPPISNDSGQPTTQQPPHTFPVIIIVDSTNMPKPLDTPAQPVVPDPAPVKPVPALIPTAITIEDISKYPPYSGCYGNPVASFFVTVSDQDGDPMSGQEISFEGSAENYPKGTLTTDVREPYGVGALLHYTVKDMEKGDVKLTFTSGKLATSTSFTVEPVSDPKPAYCS